MKKPKAAAPIETPPEEFATLKVLEAELAKRRARTAQSTPGIDALTGEYVDKERGLLAFIRYFWHVLEPETKLVEGWALEALCQHLEAVTLGKITRLLINIPPGFSKSLTTEVMWPAWEWGPMNMPHLRYVAFSYSSGLTERDNTKFRTLVTSQEYKDLWGDRFELEKEGEVKITNNKTGSKFASSVKGIGTGERGDRIVCFPHHELVWTESGPRQIGDVVERREQVKVWSLNQQTQQMELQNIVGWHKNPGRKLVKISISGGGVLECTLDHKIWTECGEVAAGLLAVGDNLLAAPSGMLCAASAVVGPQIQLQMSPNSTCSYRSYGLVADLKLSSKSHGRIFMAARDLSDQFFCEMRSAISKCSVQLRICNVLHPRTIMKIIKPRISSVAVFVSDLLSSWHGAYEGFCNYLMDKFVRSSPVFCQSNPRIALVGPRRHKVTLGYPSLLAPGLSFIKAPHLVRKPGDLTRKSTNASLVRDFIEPLKSDYRQPRFVTVTGIDLLQDTPPATYCLTVQNNHNLVCGRLANIICSNCDDPHSVQQSESDVVRNETLRWFRETMINRLNDQSASAIVIIMQRVHQSDVSGLILEKQWDYCHLMIPMEFEIGRSLPNPLGWVDPRTEEGENAWPERFSANAIEKLKLEMGSWVWAAQYLQRPAPRGGGIIEFGWWQPYTPESAQFRFGEIWPKYPTMSYTILSIDTAQTEKKLNDPSAGVLLGICQDTSGRNCVMLMWAWAERLEFYELCNKVEQTCKDYRVHRVIIEDKASGLPLASELRRRGKVFSERMAHSSNQKTRDRADFGVQSVTPEGDKVARMLSVQNLFEAGVVWAPADQNGNFKTWADRVQVECAELPKGRSDDLADALSQGLVFLRTIGLARMPDDDAYLEEDANRYKRPTGALYPTFA